MKKRIFVFILLILLISNQIYASKFKFILSPETKEATASDGEADNLYCDTIGHWCNYSAKRLYDEKIFWGIKIGKKMYFQPDTQITRGDFIIYLASALDIDIPKTNIDTPFSDSVIIPVWQKDTAYFMFDKKIIHGNMENGQLYFNHDEYISRMECAIIINNLIKAAPSVSMTAYNDSYLIPKYAYQAVKNVTDYGIIQGYEDNSFRPYIKLNRAMLADILCKLYDYSKKEGGSFNYLKNIQK